MHPRTPTWAPYGKSLRNNACQPRSHMPAASCRRWGLAKPVRSLRTLSNTHSANMIRGHRSKVRPIIKIRVSNSLSASVSKHWRCVEDVAALTAARFLRHASLALEGLPWGFLPKPWEVIHSSPMRWKSIRFWKHKNSAKLRKASPEARVLLPSHQNPEKSSLYFGESWCNVVYASMPKKYTDWFMYAFCSHPFSVDICKQHPVLFSLPRLRIREAKKLLDSIS